MAEKDKLAQGDEELVVAPVALAALAAKHRVWPLMLGLLLGVPLTSYLTIDFLVLPKLVAAIGAPAAVPAAAGAAPSAAPNSAPAQHAASGKELTVDFGKIMVNLAGAEGNRYLRINLVLAGNNPGIKEIIKTNDVALRDGVITVLSAQSLSNLEANDGRETARRALISRINGILGGPVVSQIYFTDFVIQ
jgi:flagellar FliL protein